MVFPHALDLIGDFERRLLAPRPAGLALDIVESDETLEFVADVPGVADEAVTIEVCRDVLTIEIDRPAVEANGHVLARGRSAVSGRAAFRLPDRYALDTVTANIDRGVLTVTVSVDEKAVESRRVPVSVGSAAELAADS